MWYLTVKITEFSDLLKNSSCIEQDAKACLGCFLRTMPHIYLLQIFEVSQVTASTENQTKPLNQLLLKLGQINIDCIFQTGNSWATHYGTPLAVLQGSLTPLAGHSKWIAEFDSKHESINHLPSLNNKKYTLEYLECLTGVWP